MLREETEEEEAEMKGTPKTNIAHSTVLPGLTYFFTNSYNHPSKSTGSRGGSFVVGRKTFPSCPFLNYFAFLILRNF